MSQRSPWDSTLSDARAFTAAGRFDDAERALKAALGTAQGAKAPPSVIAALQLELGRALWRKGGIAPACAALEAAVTWYAGHEPRSASALAALLELARALAAGQLPGAEQRFAQAVALARVSVVAELPGALHAFARYQLGRGEVAQAQPLLAEARRLLVDAKGDAAKVLLARVHQDEGDLASSQGQLQIAAQSYALAIDVLGEREHGDDLETVEPSRRLAATLARTGRAAEACELLAQLVELLEAAQGGAHPSVGVVLSDLATATWAMGKADEVEPLYRRALAMLEPRPEGVELYLANVLTQLGSLALYGKDERLEEAQRLYHRALAITEAMLGKEHPEVATLFKHLAVAHMKAQELERAEPLARAALRIEERFDRSGFRALNAASILGSILFQRGQHAAAVPLLERTVRGLAAAQAPANVLGPIEQQLAEAKAAAAR